MDEDGTEPPGHIDPIIQVFVIEATFPLGMLVATPGAVTALEAAGQSAPEFLSRHVRRDWGELDEEDRAANNYALSTFGRLLSAYTMASGQEIWIITEGDRSATTLLLPAEY